MPVAVDVDTDTYAGVGAALLAANVRAVDVVLLTATVANHGHGMAGVDTTGAEWAAAYDTAAATALQAGAGVTGSLGIIGDVLVTGARNLAAAEEAGTAPPAPVTPSSAAVSAVVSAPPSANGTPLDPPPGWPLVAHLLAWTWPCGHQDLLHGVASGWRLTAQAFDAEADLLTPPIGELSGMRSPEIEAAVSVCARTQISLRTLAEVYGVIGATCAAYADHLDEAHHEIITELTELLAQEVAIQVAGAALSELTAGASEVAAETAVPARVAYAASRIDAVLARLAAIVRALAKAVGPSVDRAQSVLDGLADVRTQQATLAAVTALAAATYTVVDLRAQETAGGHTMERHVAKSDEYLRGRTKVRVASTFTSTAAAVDAISATIASNRQAIADWLATKPTEPEAFWGTLRPGAGRSYVRATETFVEPTRTRVVLTPTTDGGYIVVTAMPDL